MLARSAEKETVRNCGKQVSGPQQGAFYSKTCEPPEPAQELGEQLIGAPEKPVQFPIRVSALIIACICDLWSHTYLLKYTAMPFLK